MEMWPLSLLVTGGIAVIGFIIYVADWHGKVNMDRNTFREFMSEVRVDIKKILERLPSPTIESKSPIRLNDLGQNVSERLDATTWAVNESEKLVEKVENLDALGIQETAFQHAQGFDPPGELREKMRTCAYETGIDLSGVRDVLGVELRDVLLGKRGFHESELDNHETDADS